MMREDFLNIMDKCGVIDLYDDGDAYVSSGNIGDWVECMRAVEQATLERATKHFDERGKYADGSWSVGWYDPKDPGEILRGLAEGKELP